jgi:threonine synthase
MDSKVLLYSDKLSKKYNSQIYLKPEWYGPTGSHKDKWAKKTVDIIINKGINKVVTISSGNQGLALAAEAQKHNIECVVLTWEEMSKKYVPLFKKYNAKLIIVKSSKERAAKFNVFVKEGYFPCFLTLNQRKRKNTIGIEGYKKISKEIVNSLRNAPDIIIIPTCYGDLAKGIFDGFVELKNAKTIKKLPKFILARAKDPIGDIALSISTNVFTKYVKEVLKETQGQSVFLINKDFIEAKKSLKQSLNLNVEYASAGSIAALKKLKKETIEGKVIISILTALDR